MSKIVCLGILVADAIAKPIDSFPEKGKLVLADRVELHTGGCATNAAIDLSRIGEDVGVIGLVGRDVFGDFVKNRLREERVDTSGLKTTDKANTSVSFVFSSSDGERTFIHSIGANGVFCRDDIDMDIIKRCEVLFIAGSLLMPAFDGQETADILKEAKNMGKCTVLDTAWDSTGRWMKAIGPCLPYIDYFMPSYEEACMLSGKKDEREIAGVFLSKGAKNVVVKLGSRGCFIKNSYEEHYIESFKVDAVDTNGAGDSFVAGFISGLVSGWDLRRCGEFGNAVGAHCVMKMGASEGVKSKEEILRFIHDRKERK